MSLVEAAANVAVGFGVAVLTQMLVLPWFGVHMSLTQNLKLATAFTLISIVRSFALRRLFEAIRTRNNERQSAALVRRRRPGVVVLTCEFCKPDLYSRSSRR